MKIKSFIRSFTLMLMTIGFYWIMWGMFKYDFTLAIPVTGTYVSICFFIVYQWMMWTRKR